MRQSLADKLREEDPAGAAAAKACVQAISLVSNDDMKTSDYMTALGLTEDRVEEVINGDGNMRVSTLARFLHVQGYDLEMRIVPKKRG